MPERVLPEDLVVGKTYWATNLGQGAAKVRADVPQQHWSGDQAIVDGFNFKPEMRFVVTIESKKKLFVPPPLLHTIPWPWEIKLGNIRRIVGKGGGKGWELEDFVPSTYTPLWTMIMSIPHAPVFYKRKSTSSALMQKVFSSKKLLYPTHGVVTHAMGYGGRRKAKRRRRTRRGRRYRRRKRKRRTRRKRRRTRR